jgi:hypothetical protein
MAQEVERRLPLCEYRLCEFEVLNYFAWIVKFFLEIKT